jgi:predicted Zn-dependent protease
MSVKRFAASVLLMGALFVFLQGCSTVPVTGRQSLNLISSTQEMELGLTSFEALKKETPVSKDKAANDLVQRVGKRIAQVAGPDMPNAQWEFVVFESPEANAFCLPGGKVGVYTGLLPIAKTDAGLATVIGHEIGHAVAHHGAERMSEAMVIQTGGQLLGTGLSSYDPKVQSAAALAYGLGSKVGRELPHSRQQESEADQIGLIYMARAGYDPAEAIAFWKRFSAAKGTDKAPPGLLEKWLSTHPVDSERIQNLERLLPQAQAELKKNAK